MGRVGQQLRGGVVRLILIAGQGEYPPTVALLPTPLFELFLLNVKSFGWFIVEPLSPLDAMPVILHL